MSLPFVEGKIRMTHSQLAGVEVYETQAAYRAAWYDAGWRSIDDPLYAGSPLEAAKRFIATRPGWGEHWRTARTQAGSRTPRVAVYMASTGVGENSTDQRNKAFIGLTRIALQTRYGDGGSGFLGPANRTNGGNPGAGPVTQTGAWTDVTTDGGLNLLSVRPTTSGNGATMTFPVSGTIVDVFVKTDPTYGSFTWTIDSNPQTAIAMDETASIKRTTVTGLSAGAHSVVITASTGTGRLIGAMGRNTTGIVVDNFSVGAMTFRDLVLATTNMSATDPADNTVIGRSLDALTAIGGVDLVAIMLTANEAIFEPAPTIDDIWNALDVIHSQIITSGPTIADPPDIVVLIEHIGKADTLPAFAFYARDWIQYTAAVKAWADTIGAATLDVWAMGRHSWDYWESLDYWATADGNPSNAEPVHLHDAAHAAIANPLIELLTQA